METIIDPFGFLRAYEEYAHFYRYDHADHDVVVQHSRKSKKQADPIK